MRSKHVEIKIKQNYLPNDLSQRNKSSVIRYLENNNERAAVICGKLK